MSGKSTTSLLIVIVLVKRFRKIQLYEWLLSGRKSVSNFTIFLTILGVGGADLAPLTVDFMATALP